MDALKKLLSEECNYHLPDELMDEFLGNLTEVRLKSGERLIHYGQMDDNLYVMRSGIVRYCYFDGEKEKTFAFAIPGNVVVQYSCYYLREPSFFQLEACGDAVVMKIPKARMDGLVESSHEFSKWMMNIFLEHLYSRDKKLSLINGMAKERFLALIQNRPEIMSRVPLKIIATYLDITPQYLSQLRKAHFKKQ
jgi:CRP-like cAMP-binding protein